MNPCPLVNLSVLTVRLKLYGSARLRPCVRFTRRLSHGPNSSSVASSSRSHQQRVSLSSGRNRRLLIRRLSSSHNRTLARSSGRPRSRTRLLLLSRHCRGRHGQCAVHHFAFFPVTPSSSWTPPPPPTTSPSPRSPLPPP